MSVSAMSHPSSGILLVGTAFLPSLTFPTCSSSYSWQIFFVMGIFFTSLQCNLAYVVHGLSLYFHLVFAE